MIIETIQGLGIIMMGLILATLLISGCSDIFEVEEQNNNKDFTFENTPNCNEVDISNREYCWLNLEDNLETSRKYTRVDVIGYGASLILLEDEKLNEITTERDEFIHRPTGYGYNLGEINVTGEFIHRPTGYGYNLGEINVTGEFIHRPTGWCPQ